MNLFWVSALPHQLKGMALLTRKGKSAFFILEAYFLRKNKKKLGQSSTLLRGKECFVPCIKYESSEFEIRKTERRSFIAYIKEGKCEETTVNSAEKPLKVKIERGSKSMDEKIKGEESMESLKEPTETCFKCPLARGKTCIYEDTCESCFTSSPCWFEQHGP